jgi:hypothetical membrane protein
MKKNMTGNAIRNVRLTTAGLFLFTAGFIIFMGITTGEMLYTLDFNTRDHYISELAAALPEGTITPQPSASIFNLAMMIGGLMVIVASFLTFSTHKRLLTSIPLGLFGLGILGVGVFPGDKVPWHGIFANLLFLAGGVGAVISFRMVLPPLRYLFVFLGGISLVFLFTFNHFVPMLGVGGAERWAFYPLVFWITGFGGYLLGLIHSSKSPAD